MLCDKPNCEADIPGGAKFCPGCGDTLAKGAHGGETFTDALEALDLLAGGNAGLGLEIELDDDAAGDVLFKSAGIGDDEVDAGPLVEALLKANNRIADYVTEIGREVRAVRRENGVLAAALAARMRAEGEMAKSAAAFVGRPAGPKSRQVAVTEKPLGSGAAVGGDAGPVGGELLMKCNAAMAAGRLSADDIIRTEAILNIAPGQGVEFIKSEIPDLGFRIEAALGAVN